MNDLKFIVDSMLGNMARKLRLFGYDSIYFSTLEDKVLLKISLKDFRIVLTKDRQLHQQAIKTGCRCILIKGDDNFRNILHVLKECDINFIQPVPNPKTRCTLCNCVLMNYDKSLLRDRIPKKVYDKATLFFQCTCCLKIYWDGIHIKNINTLIKNINHDLSN